MEELKQVMVAIVGIGHTGEDASILTSQLIPGLTSETLSACSVGDVILHFYDEQGRFSFDALSERVIGASGKIFCGSICASASPTERTRSARLPGRSRAIWSTS